MTRRKFLEGLLTTGAVVASVHMGNILPMVANRGVERETQQTEIMPMEQAMNMAPAELVLLKSNGEEQRGTAYFVIGPDGRLQMRTIAHNVDDRMIAKLFIPDSYDTKAEIPLGQGDLSAPFYQIREEDADPAVSMNV